MIVSHSSPSLLPLSSHAGAGETGSTVVRYRKVGEQQGGPAQPELCGPSGVAGSGTPPLLGGPPRLRSRRQSTGPRETNPLCRVLGTGLLRGHGAVYGHTGRNPLVTVPLQHPARRIRVNVTTPRGAFTERNRPARAGRRPVRIPACSPSVQRLVVHRPLPGFRSQSVPRPHPGHRRPQVRAGISYLRPVRSGDARQRK